MSLASKTVCLTVAARQDMQIGVEMSKALENKRVFIVDDDEITRAALQFMLHDEFEAHEVPDIGRAFEKAKSQPPDLILLSEGLVKADGLDLIDALRHKIDSAKILIVVDAGNTAYGKECVAAGAHGFIAKPLKVEFVRQKVDVMLGRSAGGVTIPLTVLSMR